jgi:uncharacterized damage-inducible protein DinB
MLGRPHAERLRYDLDEIRRELIAVVRKFPPEEMDGTPAPGMKSCKALLLEIGAMEALNRRWVSHQEMLDWQAVWETLEGDSVEAVLAALDRVRAETLVYLDNVTEDQLQTPIPLPEVWRQFFDGAAQIEPEELLRWIIRHEYYHLGQLVTYRWMRGDSP